MSHEELEKYYRNILGNPFFSLDRDCLYGDSDLQVSVSSQLGGLDGKRRRSVDKNSLLKYGAIYENTLHSSWFNKDVNVKVKAELQSDLIQKDIANLLGSSDDNFADTIRTRFFLMVYAIQDIQSSQPYQHQPFLRSISSTSVKK